MKISHQKTARFGINLFYSDVVNRAALSSGIMNLTMSMSIHKV
jgi:hypothetical protein